MRNFLSALTVLSMTLWVSSAHATLTFSNVSYTANSVTFTINGDMTGYGTKNDGYEDQFSLVYGGDIWVGDSEFEPNSWSRAVFDNKSFTDGGNTGTSGNSYTWSQYSSPLADAVVNNATITVTLTEADLNEAALYPQITFVWGNGSRPEIFTVLGTWGGGIPAEPAVPVPTLSQWALIILAMLLGLAVFAGRKRLLR